MLRPFYGLLLLLLLSAAGTQAQVLASSAEVGTQLAANAPTSAARPLIKPDSVYVNPEVLPSFMGGMPALNAYITKNMHYPEQAQRQHLGAKVYISFIVNATGRVQDVQVVRGGGGGGGLDDEAKRLVWLMPAWQPGQQQGQPVRTACTIPIVFQP